MDQLEFANREFFWLLAVLPIFIVWYVLRFKRSRATLRFSAWRDLPASPLGKQVVQHAVFGFKLLAVAALIVALTRPQSATSWQNVSTEGIDIVIALDISGSMLARDFSPNRLEASKEVAQEFIRNRPTDRMGLVVYAGESFTQCPLTTDHSVLINLFQGIENGMIDDGTAIGMGLATAVNRLKESDAKSKVVILLTDGSNNSGNIPPITAAEIAQAFDIRVYTIGVGTNGYAPMPVRLGNGQIVYEKAKVFIDEETLKQIATQTGGSYFRATDNTSLADIYKEIDQLEKSKVEVTEYRKRKEEYAPFLWAGGTLLLLSFVVQQTWLRSVT